MNTTNPSRNVRRAFLAQLAAAAMLPGCRCGGLLGARRRGAELDASLVVDAHCHFFNGQDLDIFRYAAAELNERKLLDELQIGALWVLSGELRKAAPSTAREMALLGPGPLGAAAAGAGVEDREKEVQRILDAIPAQLRSNPSPVSSALPMAAPGISKVVDQIGMEGDVTEPAAYYGLNTEAVIDTVQKLLSGGVRSFFAGFLRYRVDNARRYFTLFPSVDLATPAMVDMDRWLKWVHPSYQTTASESMRNQVTLWGRIAVVMQGRILPLAGFCPLRQVEWEQGRWTGERPLTTVERALTEHGCGGVKIYPVMGFRPMGNASLADRDFTEGIGITGLGAKLDRALDALYALCERHGAHVMGHTSDSHGSMSGYSKRTAPEFWGLAAQRWPRVHLNAAHCGGGGAIQHSGPVPDGDWMQEFVRLMRPSNRLYADTGFFDFITKTGSGGRYAARLRDWTAADPGIIPQQRLLWGTDWYMLAISGREKCYFDYWNAALYSQSPDAWEDFHGRNAVRMMSLNDPAKSARLRRFYSQHSISPAWLPMAEAVPPESPGV